MAVYLSPAVFPREIDLSVLPTGVGPLRPVFIGTAKKGPVNTPMFVSNSTQALNTFGEPFPESFLMYAVLHYMEEGNQCYIMRVAVEYDSGQAQELQDIAIDTSGSRIQGWGRIPLFAGIDYGRINLRAVTASKSVTFHAASVDGFDFNDADVSTTDGATDAAASATGTYTGAIDDTFVLVITSAPDLSSGAAAHGAEYEVVRNSDSVVVAEGTLTEPTHNGVTDYISIGDGVSIRLTVTSGVLDVNDTFVWAVHPDNRKFTVAVDGTTGSQYTMPAATYTTVATFVAALNGLLSSEDYTAVSYTGDDEVVIPQLRTDAAGKRIQLVGTKAFALEMGTQQYAWDVPKSYLYGIEDGPYSITSNNNRVKINVIGTEETKEVEFSIPVGTQSAAALATAIDSAGTVAGTTYFESFTLTVPSGEDHVFIVANNDFDVLNMLASYANLKTLRFAEEIGIDYPYKRSYRSFNDSRVSLPASGETTADQPLSCEIDSGSDSCAVDSAYFENIVGWFVAVSPGTWADEFTVSVEVFTDGVGDTAGRYVVTVKDASGAVVDQTQDVSFDKTSARYVGNLFNPGGSLVGTNGNPYLNWEDRPAFLDNDPNLTSFTVRYPSPVLNKGFVGTANGIPLDPSFSSELDSAIIGNPALSTGIFAFQNPETYDINLLCIPGVSSGAVIGQALQMCEARGDVLCLVDPPFGLRPQQVVNWHNGMLLSDMTAAINSSYGALYWGWLRTFDQFNSQEIWVPPSGHVAAVFSRTSRVAEQWYAPAGLRRGRLLTALDVEYSPTQGERDLLYGSGNAVNAIVKFPQDGITIWGQRTLQRSASALDRVGVRMLLIYLKKNLTRVLRNFIFEPNDRVLWAQVDAAVSPFLADVQARRGLTAYKVIVDETNNTPERIDRNELWVSIIIKPTRSVEFVVLNLAVIRTGASFSAEEVLAAAGVVTA